MEKRKDSLSALKLCRFCLSQDETLRSLYDRSRASQKSIPFSLKILSCVSIEVLPSDKMPPFICKRCSFFMDIFYEYKQIFRQADETILQYVQSGTALEPIVWPTSLVKAFRHGTRPSDVGVVQTIVEGGATIEVTSQDVSDSEEDEENVYSVKIEDGSDEGGSTCIKVVTSKDNREVTKEKPKRGKGFATVAKLTRHVRSHAGERPYPCKYCEKSFMKSHHYTRHMRIKHHETIRTARGPFGMADQYRCEQCEDSFATQDELIYHSAIHATQNLICPLCQEKFENVDAVTAHIKSHVNGTEFMCEFCELVFTTKEKLDNHFVIAHDEELRSAQEMGQDESSMEIIAEEDDDDNINVKEEDDHMVVEIKKPDNFMLPTARVDTEEKMDNTNSEESETDITYAELSTVDTLSIVRKDVSVKAAPAAPTVKHVAPAVATIVATEPKSDKPNDNQTASILRKAEEMKRKVVLQQTSDSSSSTAEKKEKTNSKVESSNSVGANDKSLRLLEKELQELKRTTRIDANKTPNKSAEPARSSSRRLQVHTSTPKLRSDDKKTQPFTKTTTMEKKLPERRAVKENKEPKDAKEAKTINTSAKEEKEVKINNNAKEETKEKETPKPVIKNGPSEKPGSDEGVRRSTRPSKIKDYAKMIRDRSQDSEQESETDDDDEEYKDAERTSESRLKGRRSSIKQTPKTTTTTTTTTTTKVAIPGTRKRGRPRKDQSQDVPSKVKKDDQETEIDAENKSEKGDAEDNEKPKEIPTPDTKEDSEKADENTSNDMSSNVQQKKPGVLVSPSGQTLKKVPVKALPPGVKPIPLPVNPRPVGPRELCEMQIGKKVVKVQKIVMTKAEVEAMAKKGLVEMKDGTMVLKQGIKIPTSDPAALKSSLVGEEAAKETSKKDKATPTRCDIDEA